MPTYTMTIDFCLVHFAAKLDEVTSASFIKDAQITMKSRLQLQIHLSDDPQSQICKQINPQWHFLLQGMLYKG